MQRGRSRLGAWGIGLIIALVCTLCAFGLAKLFHRGGGSGFGNVLSLNIEGVKQVQVVPNGFVYYNNSSIARVGSDGTSRWSYMIGKESGFNASENGVAAWNGKGFTLLDVNNGSTGYSGTFDTEILSAKVGSQYCAVMLGPDGNSTIMLMERNGRFVDSLTFADQLVVDYGFFYDGSLFWVMTLDSNGTAPNCTVSVFRPGKRMVGNISDVEQVLYKPVFRATDILCGGDTFLKTYSYTGEEDESSRKLIYGYTIADVYESAGIPTIALVPNEQFGGDASLKDVRVIRGNTDVILHMPYDCVSIVAQENIIYGFSANGMLMVGDISAGSVNAYSVGATCLSVAGITQDGKAVLTDTNTVRLISLE